MCKGLCLKTAELKIVLKIEANSNTLKSVLNIATGYKGDYNSIFN